jgi:predicted enzyme related to lactoylglutathione lyase
MAEIPKAGEFCWNELACANVQAAKDFYSKVFGWKFMDSPMGETTYTMIKLNDKDVGGIWAIPKDQQKQIPPHWMAYILVQNLDEALEKAKKNGANIVKPATNAGDFGRFGIIQDPTGAHIALWQTLKM